MLIITTIRDPGKVVDVLVLVRFVRAYKTILCQLFVHGSRLTFLANRQGFSQRRHPWHVPVLKQYYVYIQMYICEQSNIGIYNDLFLYYKIPVCVLKYSRETNL